MNSIYHPAEIKIEVTYRCPLACVHCSSNAYNDNPIQMSYEKCKDIVNQSKELGVSEISFSGGEPLIWEYIDDIISLTHEHGIYVSVYTSGNIPNIVERFSKLKSEGLDRAVFSVYSFNAQNHERITRIYGSFDKTISSIQECIKVGISTEIHFVAVSQTFRELYQVALLCKKIGVSKISVLRFVPQGRGTLYSQGILSKRENLELIKIIKDLRNDGYDIRTGSPFNVLMLNKNPECYAAKNRMIISPDLRIYPCDAFKKIYAEDIVGTLDSSILDNNTLEECWNNSYYLNKIREELEQPAGEPCSKCLYFDSCKSGCLAQKFICYKKLSNVQDPACLKI
jgi:radical SAM protein with 4Fe4S-binding SPASM domain